MNSEWVVTKTITAPGSFFRISFAMESPLFSSPLISISRKNSWWAPLSVMACSRESRLSKVSGALHGRARVAISSLIVFSIRNCCVISSSKINKRSMADHPPISSSSSSCDSEDKEVLSPSRIDSARSLLVFCNSRILSSMVSFIIRR